MPGCPHVHAAFYLWYGTLHYDGVWRHWDHPTLPHWTAAMNERYPPDEPFTPPDSPHSPFYPARGLYSSADMEVTRAQMASLRVAGVDSVMLSWWGRTDANITRDSQGVDTDVLVPDVLDAAAAAGIGVSWHLEPYGGRSPSSVLRDLRYLHERYGAHPAVWRQGPRRLPLIFLYDVSAEHSGEGDQRAAATRAWAGMVRELRRSDADAVLLSLYHDRRDADFVVAAGFDGAYAQREPNPQSPGLAY